MYDLYYGRPADRACVQPPNAGLAGDKVTAGSNQGVSLSLQTDHADHDVFASVPYRTVSASSAYGFCFELLTGAIFEFAAPAVHSTDFE